MTTKKMIRIKSREFLASYPNKSLTRVGWDERMINYAGMQLLGTYHEDEKSWEVEVKDSTSYGGKQTWWYLDEWVEQVDLFPKKYKVWRTYEGKEIPYPEIEDTHLANILHWMKSRPGQFNKTQQTDIQEEANRRGLSTTFMNGAPYPFKDKNGTMMIATAGGSIVKATESDLKKEKFFRDMDKRVLEREAEEDYWEKFDEHIDDFILMHKLKQEFSPGDAVPKKYASFMLEKGQDKTFMAMYNEWHEDYHANGEYYADDEDLDLEEDEEEEETTMGDFKPSWYDEAERRHKEQLARDEFLRSARPVQPAQPVKPLDDPKLHEALQNSYKVTHGGSMLSTKSINKLNGLKPGEEKIAELTQATSEQKTITLDLVSILKDAPVIKALKLGEEALLKAFAYGTDSIQLTISLGTVEKEVNAQVQAALAALVK